MSSIFWWEAIFKKNIFPLPCKECPKSFSETGSLKALIQEKSHLLVKNVPNNYLWKSHSPVPCSLFHKRKSIVPFKDSKNSNLISTFSLLHNFWILSSFFFKYVFKYVLIVEEIIENEKRKVVELSVSFSNSSFPTIVMTKLKIPSLVNIVFNYR